MNASEMKTDDDYTTMLDTTECITVGETAALALNALYCLISINDCEIPRPESLSASFRLKCMLSCCLGFFPKKTDLFKEFLKAANEYRDDYRFAHTHVAQIAGTNYTKYESLKQIHSVRC